MKLRELIPLIDAKILAQGNGDPEILCGYTCDLLSWVMAHGEPGMAWVTVQTHLNVIAVAVLSEMACVILPESIEMEQESLDFHHMVSEGYRSLLSGREDVERIDGSLDRNEIQEKIRSALFRLTEGNIRE